MPLRDQSALLVITEFDGPLDPYVLDFAIAIGDVFDAILGCVRDHPPLPVRDHPQAFIDFVRKNNQVYVAPDTPYSGEYPIYSAYPDKTVIDIIGARTDPVPPPTEAKRVSIDLADVQGNILRGYRASVARHFAVRFGDGAVARRFLQLLVDGDESACPRVTSAALWGDADRPLYFLNVGVTAQGLQALGVPDALRSRLPRAFVEGPADPERAQLNRDLGASAPADWELGGPSQPVHFLVSLHADDRPDSLEEFDLRSGQLTGWWKRNGGTLVVCHDACALPGEKVHFGYREGMAQPRVAGVQSDTGSDMQPLANVGEFLLGKDYPDIYGGTSLKSMPPQLCQNATFAAVRVLDQDVAAFEKLLDTAALQTGAEREWLAAKLMGRWRDGTPLPAAPTAGCNEFDYAPSHRYPQLPNDHEGLVCPVGSHIRRMNPRSALVAGRPHSRRLIRRGMPYGPVFDPRNPDRERRGLYGIFICADLERQFEFLLQEWANRDSSASGIRGTQDPIIGAQDLGGEFLIPVAGRGDGPFKLKVPRLVTTRGSLYLLLPSIEGLRFLARGEGFTSSAVSSAQSIVPQRRNERKGAGFDPKAFDPKDPRFLADPYPYYAWFRQHAPVARVTHGGYESFWVFSHELVTAACDATDLFLKRPANEKDVRGLFFMDPPRHTEVRGVIEPLFEQAIADTSATAREQADAAIDEIRAGESVFDLICSYSNRVTRNVFMEMFGLPPADWDMLGALVHTVLNHSDQMLPDGERAPAGAAGASLGAYFHEGWHALPGRCGVGPTAVPDGPGRASGASAGCGSHAHGGAFRARRLSLDGFSGGYRAAQSAVKAAGARRVSSRRCGLEVKGDRGAQAFRRTVPDGGPFCGA